MSTEAQRVGWGGWPIGAVVALPALLVLAVAAAFTTVWLLPPLAVVAGVVAVHSWRLRGDAGLQIDQIDRLRRAELALAAAGSTQAAARELADHAIALLGAASATVLIEGIGDTARVTAGESDSLYGNGSRMRLLDDAGVPCGSIAVSARGDGKPYSAAQERMLDALAQRVSSTLHRLSLFAEVHAERRTLADVLGSSSDGIFAVGLDLAVRAWNPAMARITGVTTGDAVGQPVSSVFCPVAEDGTPRHGTGDPGRSGDPHIELVRVSPDCDRWLLCSWSPLSEGGYVVVARDETERKKLQDDKDGWIAQVSHELRTPLTPIKGFLQTLQRRDHQFAPEDRQRIYEVMLREERRLEELVGGLLRATSLSGDAPVLQREVLDLTPIIERQVEACGRANPARIVSLDVAADLPRAEVDPDLVGGILAGLLSNAAKYSPATSPIDVRAHAAGDEILITVSDEGPGVPVDDRERIFDKFTRLGDHLTRPQQGVGLGLYIARRSAEQLGGRVTCSEPLGGGAAFSLALPAEPSMITLPGASPAREPRPLRA